MINICEICNKKFKVKPSREKRCHARFCSWQCFKTKIIRICLYCNKNYEIQRWEKKISKYCSHACHSKAKKQQVGCWTGKKRLEINNWLKDYQYKKGKDHPNWKNGISFEDWNMRHSYKYQKWALTIKERDNYTCKICGYKNKFMHADHIKPFALYPGLRLELSNGRTLCIPCHKKTESYGIISRKFL